MTETLSQKESHWMKYYELWRGSAYREDAVCVEHSSALASPSSIIKYKPKPSYMGSRLDIAI